MSVRPLKHLVSMSGGKDSTATALVAMETMPRDSLLFIAADTGNEHQITYEYWDYLECALGISIIRLRQDFTDWWWRRRDFVRDKWPGKGVDEASVARVLDFMERGPTGNPFLDLCIIKGRFPSRRAQFCTQYLKTEPLTEYALEIIDAGSDVWSWQGVRANESEARRWLKPFEVVGGGLYNYRPILRGPSKMYSRLTAPMA